MWGQPALRYDISSYERIPGLGLRPEPWLTADVEAELARRAEAATRERQLFVDYYRIGYRVNHPLPLAERPDPPPATIPGVPRYPWSVWLGWALEERWHALFAAWRRFADERAAQVLIRDIDALCRWRDYHADDGTAGLFTASIAGCLAEFQREPAGWPDDVASAMRSASERLLADSVAPWFTRVWGGGVGGPAEMHNIRVIALVRAAELAETIGSRDAATLTERSIEVLDAWRRYRTEHRHSEGPGYDGYQLDHVSAWLDASPVRDALLPVCRDAFLETTDGWLDLALPGRVDLLAPVGDTEAEMPFWAVAALRVCRWFPARPSAALLRRFPLRRLPASGLVEALRHTDAGIGAASPFPAPGVREHVATVTLRTGWRGADILAAIGASRAEHMGHLHRDGGHLLLAWEGRCWITDPGYQQYRHDAEREYTLGPDAHNAPQIGGHAQQARAAEVLAADERDGVEHAALDLSACYPTLPMRAQVRRDVWFTPARARVLVRDRIDGLDAGTDIVTSWLGGAGLAWSCGPDWARLSDGTRALWLRVGRATVELTRHPGSRGPLALRVSDRAAGGRWERWWLFQFDSGNGWEPPVPDPEPPVE